MLATLAAAAPVPAAPSVGAGVVSLDQLIGEGKAGKGRFLIVLERYEYRHAGAEVQDPQAPPISNGASYAGCIFYSYRRYSDVACARTKSSPLNGDLTSDRLSLSFSARSLVYRLKFSAKMTAVLDAGSLEPMRYVQTYPDGPVPEEVAVGGGVRRTRAATLTGSLSASRLGGGKVSSAKGTLWHADLLGAYGGAS